MPRKKKKARELRSKSRPEPKQRNWTVQHVMRRGVQKHRNKKREDKNSHKE